MSRQPIVKSSRLKYKPSAPTAKDITPYEERFTSPYLSSFEMTVVIEKRAKDIDRGSVPLIELPEAKPDDVLSSIDIAMLELETRVLPSLVVRKSPGGLREVIPVIDLLLPDDPYLEY